MNYLGIDLGGTNIKAGIVNSVGKILINAQIPTEAEKGLEQTLKNIESLSMSLIEKGKKDGLELQCAGVGVPGPVDESGTVIKCVNLNWPIIPISEILERRLGMRVFAGNDGNAAAIGEYEVGALKGVESGVALTLGTGIGGGVILNGKCRIGFYSIGAEIGHMIVGENFYDCNCGRNGCLETFSSATAVIAYTKKLLDEGRQSSLKDIYKGDYKCLDGATIMKQSELGDAICNEAVDRAAKYLGIGIVNLSSVIDPQRIAIGGGLSKAGARFFEKIREAVSNYRYFKDFPIPEIVPAKFGNEAGVVGAAMLAKSKDHF